MVDSDLEIEPEKSEKFQSIRLKRYIPRDWSAASVGIYAMRVSRARFLSTYVLVPQRQHILY